jgi:hypothetical protein
LEPVLGLIYETAQWHLLQQLPGADQPPIFQQPLIQQVPALKLIFYP